ncbi:50S ribosomal protein L25 [Dictyobacter kobayashii]|uniref:Large ribosomal subunit protein bL25 n=1 Tax=Dictyobacter kobayashii TaxID=2014872 RepID=A0A402AGT9_9CHLR|nr:50S ribosomal protein L25 [Dictyobacter kobayashii]GCE18341.1 50S ribosomal protein L25 [Dictyobacter kobayashii]
MAEKTVLEVQPRTVMGKANKRLRREGFIPANVYGHKETPTPIQLDAVTFDRLRRQHAARNIITLRLPDAPEQTALVRHVQHAPTGEVLHVDFTRVSMRERLEVKVPLHFVGVAPGVKVEGGVLLHLLDSLAVECAASAIVESLDVDITALTDIDSTLHAKDVKLPARYKLITDPEEPIVKVSAPRVELPETAPTEAAEAAPAETPAAAAEEEAE